MGEGIIRIRHDLALPVLEIAGEIDLANAAEFAAVLDGAITERPGLVVSLDDTSYFDSKGIHVLLTFAGRLDRTGHRFAIVAREGTAPRRLLEIASVASVIPIYASILEAVTAILPSGPGAPPVTQSK